MKTTHRHTALMLAAAVATAAGPSMARAQFTSATSTTHHWLAVGLGAGDVIPTGNASDNFSGSFQGQAYVVINLGILPELRFNLGYQRWNFKQQLLNNLGYPTTASGYNNVLAGIGGTRIDLMRGPIRPYLTLGIGAFNFKSTVDTITSTGTAHSTPTVSQSTLNQSSLKFGLDGGAGLAVHVGRVDVFGEARVQNVYTNKGFITSAKQIQAVPLTFGFLFAVL
jgi:hypothetical protein